MKYPILIISFLLFSLWSKAQIPVPIFHWDMESMEELEPIILPKETKAVFEQGYKNLALSLNKSTHLNLTQYLDFYEAFTLAFWFQPTNSTTAQNIFRQARKQKDAAAPKRFIDFSIRDNQAILKTEKKEKTLTKLEDLKTNDGWLWVAFVADRYGFKVFLQGKPVHQSMDGTMFRQLANYRDELLVGEGDFEGKIDEIKIFHEALEEETILQLFEDFEKGYLKQNMEQEGDNGDSIIVEETPVFVLNEKLKDRKNLKPARVVQTRAKTITLEIWDYYKKIDGDKISIYLNNEPYSFRNNLVLGKKKNRIKIRIPLAKQEDNYIIFFAENTGDFYSAATVAAYIEGMNEPVHLIANRQENPVIKVVNKHLQKKELALVQLPEIFVDKENVSIEISPLSSEDKYDRVSLEYADDAQFYNIQLLDEARKINLKLEPEGEKHFTLKGVKLGENESCALKVVVYESGKEKINRVLYPHKENYQISIRRKAQIAKVEDGKRSISIPKNAVPITSIVLEISDHDQPDGDQIKLLYEGEVIVENYKLVEKALRKEIRLKPNFDLHKFTIVAEDFGSSLEPINTPRIKVLVNGRKVDDFVFWLREGKAEASVEVLLQ